MQHAPGMTHKKNVKSKGCSLQAAGLLLATISAPGPRATPLNRQSCSSSPAPGLGRRAWLRGLALANQEPGQLLETALAAKDACVACDLGSQGAQGFAVSLVTGVLLFVPPECAGRGDRSDPLGTWHCAAWQRASVSAHGVAAKDR